MRNWKTWDVVFPLLLVSSTMTTAIFATEAKLSPHFYRSTCPWALNTIRDTIQEAILLEPRMAASLIRLNFHDCFVQGCDASILLDDAKHIVGEKNAEPNKNSARGYEVIENAKSAVEKICPGVVSCADIISIAARDASVFVGGPTWKVKLGRRDSKTASLKRAEAELPRFNESAHGVISKFKNKNLTVRDMVALSGSHTLGQAQCRFFRERLYNNKVEIDAKFSALRKKACHPHGGDNKLVPLDVMTPYHFDNNYFKNLKEKKGLLKTDQDLFNNGLTGSIVNEYIKNPVMFANDFAAAMLKMGDIEPLTGKAGEIRRKCNVINK